MKKYNVIILAGGENEDWCNQYGYNRKAFLPINGEPMLGRVIKAFRRSQYVDKIVVVGSRELDQLAAMKYVHKRVPEGKSFLQNLLHGILYVKAALYKFAFRHNGYLISFCDAAYLNTKIIDKTIANLDRHSPGLVLHYVNKDTLAKAGFPVENRSYMPVAGGKYTGSNIYYVRYFRGLLRVLRDIVILRGYRKDPVKILEHIGCKDKNYNGIAEVLSRKLKTKCKIFVSPFAEMGVDVDKPIDYELAKIELDEARHTGRKQMEREMRNIYNELSRLGVRINTHDGRQTHRET
ncbi:MAG: NTP transferase domain-containing protein [Candidatus Omnitrophica bacterium]|nr:NTP transferase domain-containing protein [Candidatus Omnitrophota bacterium]